MNIADIKYSAWEIEQLADRVCDGVKTIPHESVIDSTEELLKELKSLWVELDWLMDGANEIICPGDKEELKQALSVKSRIAKVRHNAGALHNKIKLYNRFRDFNNLKALSERLKNAIGEE